MDNLMTHFNAASLQFLIGMYFVTNTFRIFSYAPQILQIYRQSDDVRAISLWTWGMWTASNFTTALYAALAIGTPDLLLVLLNLGNTLGCVSVIGLVLYKRKIYAARQNPSTAVAFSMESSDSHSGVAIN